MYINSWRASEKRTSIIFRCSFRVALFLLICVSPAAVAADKKLFEVYQSMGFIGQPEDKFKNIGIKPLLLLGHGHLWNMHDALLPEPNPVRIERFANEAAQMPVDLVSLDIELWSFSSGKNIKNKVNRKRFISVASLFRKNSPNVRFGFYGVLPQRNYWDPVNFKLGRHNSYREWSDLNHYLSPIADRVDVIMPSLYTFYRDVDNWKVYAESNISEARRYGKPVIVFICPEYQTSSDPLHPSYIDYSFWKTQLEFIHQRADGIIIWTPKGLGQKWKARAGWWTATKEFMRTINRSK